MTCSEAVPNGERWPDTPRRMANTIDIMTNHKWRGICYGWSDAPAGNPLAVAPPAANGSNRVPNTILMMMMNLVFFRRL